MSFTTKISNPRRSLRLGQRALQLSAAALALAASLSFAAPALIATAKAGDMDLSTSGAAGDDGQFVRIGLNKSVVIRLPTDAKDVIVGNPAIVDAVVRTKNTAYLFARAVGQTNIFFFNAAGQQIMNIDLEVALDMKALQKLIDRTIPGSQVTVDTVNNSVILGGTAASAAEAKLAEDLANKFVVSTGNASSVVNAINITGGDQVMLKVKVVEIKRDVVKALGIDLQAAFDVGKFAFDLATANPVNSSSLVGHSAFASGSTKIDGFLKALESEGIVRTLAEPTLSAVSGAPAKFHAGGEIPITNCNFANNNNVCTVEYKPYGVTLNFTPTVLSEGRISLNVQTTVSDLGQNSYGLNPGLDSRDMQTTIELPSGGSMMLAGLIKDVENHKLTGTPGMKDLPVLGALFRSRDYQRNQSELAIIVTPYIVNPVAESALKTPDDQYNVATDRQAILFGRLNKVYGARGGQPGGVYHGDVGYIVE